MISHSILFLCWGWWLPLWWIHKRGSYSFFFYMDMGCFLWKNMIKPHCTCNLGRSLITYNTWNKLLLMEAVILITLHIHHFLNTSRGFIENIVSVGVWCISNKKTQILYNRVYMVRMKHLQPNRVFIYLLSQINESTKLGSNNFPWCLHLPHE